MDNASATQAVKVVGSGENTAPRSQQPGQSLIAIGLLGLGVVALRYGDFAMVWQPVPDWLPARHAVADACGVLMLLLGIGLLFKASVSLASRALLPYLFVWAL